MKKSRSVVAMTVLASAPLAMVEAQTSPAGQPAPLPTVSAAAAAPASTSSATDEPLEAVVVQGHFLGSSAQSALKLDAPVRDTPFAVQSYTDSFMKAIETTNVADLYNYMTGVKRAGNTAYDMTIRGFRTSETDKSAIMVDGLPGLTGRFGSPPTIGVDHIELVKGPMSVPRHSARKKIRFPAAPAGSAAARRGLAAALQHCAD
jgi:iron complex outermembrane recepter protein